MGGHLHRDGWTFQVDGWWQPTLAVDGAPEPDDEPERPVLGDPALDNEQEMQKASADLQSSREKSATARDISDQLTAATRPETAERDRS